MSNPKPPHLPDAGSYPHHTITVRDPETGVETAYDKMCEKYFSDDPSVPVLTRYVWQVRA